MTHWTAPLKELKLYAWATLRRTPQWKNVEAVMNQLGEKKLFDAAKNAAHLHTQFGFVKNYCTDAKVNQWHDEHVSTPNRWVEIFSHLAAEHCDYGEISKVVEYILCLPGTTATVERLFSNVNDIWTEDKTRLYIETLKAVLCVKNNINYKCVDFHKFLLSQPELLRQISGKDKYQTKLANDQIILLDDDSDAQEDESDN